MKMTAADQAALGVVDLVVAEPGERRPHRPCRDRAAGSRRRSSPSSSRSSRSAARRARRGALPTLSCARTVHDDRDGRGRRRPSGPGSPIGSGTCSTRAAGRRRRRRSGREPSRRPPSEVEPARRRGAAERSPPYRRARPPPTDGRPRRHRRGWPTSCSRRSSPSSARRGLGEIEVREGDWKVRLRRPADGVDGTGRAAGRPSGRRRAAGHGAPGA